MKIMIMGSSQTMPSITEPSRCAETDGRDYSFACYQVPSYRYHIANSSFVFNVASSVSPVITNCKLAYNHISRRTS